MPIPAIRAECIKSWIMQILPMMYNVQHDFQYYMVIDVPIYYTEILCTLKVKYKRIVRHFYSFSSFACI